MQELIQRAIKAYSTPETGQLKHVKTLGRELKFEYPCGVGVTVESWKNDDGFTTRVMIHSVIATKFVCQAKYGKNKDSYQLPDENIMQFVIKECTLANEINAKYPLATDLVVPNDYVVTRRVKSINQAQYHVKRDIPSESNNGYTVYSDTINVKAATTSQRLQKRIDKLQIQVHGKAQEAIEHVAKWDTHDKKRQNNGNLIERLNKLRCISNVQNDGSSVTIRRVSLTQTQLESFVTWAETNLVE